MNSWGGVVDCLQACVKYAESESPPCQHSAEVSPITRKYRQTSVCVSVCGGLCASVSLISASVYQTEALQTAATYSPVIRALAET